VSEFLPADLERGVASAPSGRIADDSNTFTDAEVDGLVIVVKKPSSGRPGLANSSDFGSSRSMSNGSIDGRTIAEEMGRFKERQGHNLPNGGSEM
jgi:hypothetical protein